MLTHWDEKRKAYRAADWSMRPSLFAQEVVHYLPASGTLLDLGAGMGQDGYMQEARIALL